MAPRPVGLDGLVPELAGGAVMTLEHGAADRDDAADARPEGEADHRRGAPAGTETELREPERPGIVDEMGRDLSAAPTGPATGLPAQAPRS